MLGDQPHSGFLENKYQQSLTITLIFQSAFLLKFGPEKCG
ncbi:hypothetical protein ATPR_3407 [Acetobacter tropicalis NBRC 101654]|uniref:Uncharacterized protein n=1 Tax=Acetobacter tropicalis NBRC 101654 TaxID=749388 RepID=F7VJ58_9PROT|nr:hypothetical protein ATPR_3407 [Acetobacter tropicalis NBRC 101654]